MVLTLYHFPPSFPSRAALLVARAVGVDVTVKNLNLFEKEQLNPEFTKVSTVQIFSRVFIGMFYKRLWESYIFGFPSKIAPSRRIDCHLTILCIHGM